MKGEDGGGTCGRERGRVGDPRRTSAAEAERAWRVGRGRFKRAFVIALTGEAREYNSLGTVCF